ncbi:hypothetical protein Gogos_010179 [Gossypium gossypioides]|uniref:Uncharacterized protein n=1 Tax=Gossypium gossypioides TaxID=34282 RepID=A0A7J9BKC8_GOSGO|nr:hypothetical protein [Gossypium gossypioides]
MHRMIDGRVVPKAQKFRSSGIGPEFEWKLDQIFMEVDVDNDIPKENDEENTRNDVYILNDVHIDGNNQKIKTLEISSSHFKTGSKKSSKQIEEAAKCPVKIKNYAIQLTI